MSADNGLLGEPNAEEGEEGGSTVEPARTEEAICWLREGVGSGEGGVDAGGEAGDGVVVGDGVARG
jgi:hypothetical protein